MEDLNYKKSVFSNEDCDERERSSLGYSSHKVPFVFNRNKPLKIEKTYTRFLSMNKK